MAFARGIHESQKQKQQQQGSNQNNNNTSSSAAHHRSASVSGSGGNKGTSSSSGIVSQSMAASSPYGLDPSAFQSEVRFQLPAFLNPSSAAGGAPAYPNGAEAFAGYHPPEGMMMMNKQPQQHQHQSQQQQQQQNNLGYPNMSLSQPGGSGDGSNAWNNWTFKPETAPNPNAAMSAFFATQQQQQQYQGQGQSSSSDMMMMQPPPMPPQQQQQQHRPSASSSSSATAAGKAPERSSTMPTSAMNSSSLSSSATPFPSSSGGTTATAANLLSSGGLSGLVQPGTLATSTPSGANMPGLYSTTGFDILGVLARVASRRDPKTVLGPVDCSCSFTVVDVRKFDNPIVYASPTFCQLTGYEAHEIVGRNCRFLQAPDGDVQRGSRRKYTDNAAVSHLKRMLAAGKECQASLINYRKGGMPFINLLTVVPLTWDSDEVVYHVGFQVDLVEQPNAILRNMRDGSYQVSYSALQSPQPPPVVKPPPAPKPPAEPVNGLSSIDPELFKLMPSRIQDAVYNGPEDSGKMEWLKFVFENTDDFVHVLSLKGQFHYVSPSVRGVLEYEPEDLLNKHISDICHPSDIVPVMRELKDSTHSSNSDGERGGGSSGVNLVFRVRRKHSGYVWLECHGRLHVEPGKGRKAVILTGRERSVSALTWRAVQEHGGLAETEFWAKLSFDGLWLWASSTFGQVLGQNIKLTDLVGRSFYEFMGNNSGGSSSSSSSSSAKAIDVAQAIRQAAGGSPKLGAVSVRHTLNGKDVVTTFYVVNHGELDPSTGAILGSTPGASSTSSSDDSPSSTPAAGGAGGLPSAASLRATLIGSPTNQILIQVKLVAGRGPQKRLFDKVVHPLSENVFEEMDTTRGTSWQYEMHQLKISNRKLENEIKGIKNGSIPVERPASSSSPDEAINGSASDSRPKNKKRRKSSVMDGPQSSSGSGFGFPKPSADHPAPLHQQTPGFGLAPGHLYRTWN